MDTKHFTILLTIILNLFWSLGTRSVYAQQTNQPSVVARVAAYPGIIERIQPNGDTIHVYLRGDERCHYMITTDGWLVGENQTGQIYYISKQKCCLQKKEKNLHPAKDANKRSTKEKRWLKYNGVKKEI